MVVREVFGLGMPIPVGAKPVQKITKWERVSCLLSKCSGVFMSHGKHSSLSTCTNFLSQQFAFYCKSRQILF